MTGPPAGHLILIVEDNEKNLKLARDVLRFSGFQTLEAGTGEAAVDLARERRPDLILMDIELPGIDGITALQQLRANAGTADIPIVALCHPTGRASSAQGSMAISASRSTSKSFPARSARIASEGCGSNRECHSDDPDRRRHGAEHPVARRRLEPARLSNRRGWLGARGPGKNE